MKSASPDRPVMRYPGSKYRIRHWIINHFPKHKIYVEPFGGSAACLMAKNPSRVEVYNDIYDEVVNLFLVLRDSELHKRLAELIYFTPFARAEYDILFKPTHDPVEKARRFVVRSNYNRAKGPFGKSGFDTRINDDFYTGRVNYHLDYPYLIPSFYNRLRNVIIEHRPFQRMFEQFDRPETLFYCDPPYLDADTRYGDAFDETDHQKLADLLVNLEGMAIISGYPSEQYAEWYEANGWIRKQCKAYADGGHRRTECIWLCPKTQKLQSQQDLFRNYG